MNIDSRSQAHQALQSECIRGAFLAISGGSKFIRGKRTRTHTTPNPSTRSHIYAYVTANTHKSGRERERENASCNSETQDAEEMMCVEWS
jgi:hypothetical protein